MALAIEKLLKRLPDAARRATLRGVQRCPPPRW